MSHILFKLEREGEVRYFEWSTICDAPLTFGMTLEELHDYVRERYGPPGLEELPKRLERVERSGTSALPGPLSAEDLLKGNRAGAGETTIGIDEFWTRFVTERPDE